MSNPVFRNNKALNNEQLSADELNKIYNTKDPSAQSPAEVVWSAKAPVSSSNSPMTYENTIQKAVGLFAILLVGAGVGWFIPQLMLPALIAGFVIGLVNTFKREPNVALIMAYAVLQGLVVGGLTGVLEASMPGIATQAIVGTLIVFSLVLFFFSNGKLRTTPKMRKIVFIAMGGYLLFSLVNLGLMLTGVSTDPWGLRTGVEVFGIPLGVILGVFAILMASYMLVTDFEYIKDGVENKLDKRFGWTAAFGLLVTIVWLYIEILRLIAILRR